MYRGYRRFVSLALCVCFTLSMLFLNTLDVKAANVIHPISITMTLAPDVSYSNSTYGSVQGSISSISGGGGSISTTPSGGTSGYISNNSGGGGSISGSVHSVDYPTKTINMHLKVPIEFLTPISSYGLSNISDDEFLIYYANIYNWSINTGTISNLALYSSDGKYLSSSIFSQVGRGTIWDLNNYFDKNYIHHAFIIEFDYAYIDTDSNFIGKPNPQPISVSLGATLETSLGRTTSGQNGTPVYDNQANQSLDNVESATQSTAESSSGILSKVTDFFGSFFSNLIGVFVPEDGYFSSWFTRLNTLLADKLGMLYAPFDLLIQVLTSILNADDSFAGIPFPGIEWDGYYLVEPFTFTFSSLGDVYTDLQGYVYFGTDVILLLAFFGLLQEKIKHILED